MNLVLTRACLKSVGLYFRVKAIFVCLALLRVLFRIFVWLFFSGCTFQILYGGCTKHSAALRERIEQCAYIESTFPVQRLLNQTHRFANICSLSKMLQGMQRLKEFHTQTERLKRARSQSSPS